MDGNHIHIASSYIGVSLALGLSLELGLRLSMYIKRLLLV